MALSYKDNQVQSQQILQSSEFKELVATRRALALPIILTILIAYFGFILMVAFKSPILGQMVGNGHVSIGIYAGLALLVLAFALTAVYLHFSDKKIAQMENDLRNKFQNK